MKHASSFSRLAGALLVVLCASFCSGCYWHEYPRSYYGHYGRYHHHYRR